MEGLVSYGINPVRFISSAKQLQSRFLCDSQPILKKSVLGFQIRMLNNNKKKQFSPLIMAAAVGNTSQLGHFENTLPSKGFALFHFIICSNINFLCNFYFFKLEFGRAILSFYFF
jgi:hypothetical protein